MATHVDTVKSELTMSRDGRVLRNGKPTVWSIVRMGNRQFRAMADGVCGTDDRTSVTAKAELDYIAERIAIAECQ